MAKAKPKDVPENEADNPTTDDQAAASPRAEMRESIKAARADVRSLLEFVIDLQVPGHGEKQSHKLLDAIDKLIIARLKHSYDIAKEVEDVTGDLSYLIDERIGNRINEACPSLDELEKLVDMRIAAALDKATDPKDGK